ncbi:MAG TPA: alpha/beta hydrolase [Armatimonadota bacterium]|nr:alpha/beta hydrolase [Armatimonadota bacterium]
MNGRGWLCLMLIAVVGALVFGALVVAAEEPRTSENDEQVRQFFNNHPQADANGDGVLTLTEAQAFQQKLQEARARREEYEAGRPAPTHADLAYGPHERNVLDLWLAEGEGPRPLAVYIHGGGWVGGDKSSIARATLEKLLAAGISVAAVNYRYSTTAPYPAPMADAGRAIQFLRYHAEEYSLDPDRVAAFGGSAGATTSMWLAFRDDMADPESEDPVLRQSTRLTCIAPNSGPISLEIPVTTEWLGASITTHPALAKMFGVTDPAQFDDPQVQALMAEASPVNHLTADDPPAYLTYGLPSTPPGPEATANQVAHSGVYGVQLKQRMDALGIECILHCPDLEATDPYGDMVAFFKAKFFPDETEQ